MKLSPIHLGGRIYEITHSLPVPTLTLYPLCMGVRGVLLKVRYFSGYPQWLVEDEPGRNKLHSPAALRLLRDGLRNQEVLAKVSDGYFEYHQIYGR